MTSIRRFRVPSILLLALIAALAFAATASAETLTGETSGVSGSGTEPEGEITAAKASYDTATGAVNFTINTGAEPKEEVEGSASNLELEAVLAHATGACSLYALTGGGLSNQAFEISGSYAMRKAEALLVSSNGTEPHALGLAAMTVAGDTTTVSATYPEVANQPYNCAFVFVLGGSGSSLPLVFPIAAPPAAPVVTAPAPPAPAPALSFLKPKSLNLKAGKWQKENVKISNTGAVAAGPISIKLKAPKGVSVQPASGTIKLPALLPGQSWTVTFKVKVTTKAKKSSTVSVTGAGPGISATSSFAVKLLG